MLDSLPNPRAFASHIPLDSNTTTPILEFRDPFASNLVDLSNTATSPPLTIAARSGNLATTRSLLDAGANPHLDLPAEHSPLFEAARNGHLRVTRLLLAERLRAGLWGEDRHLRDGRVLREAEDRGDIEMVVLLTMPPEDVLSAEDLDAGREGRGKRDSVISL